MGNVSDLFTTVANIGTFHSFGHREDGARVALANLNLLLRHRPNLLIVSCDHARKLPEGFQPCARFVS
ncbi:MAG TPA: hypothetical protein VIJ85_00920 [Rhizomicrobium sp.]